MVRCRGSAQKKGEKKTETLGLMVMVGLNELALHPFFLSFFFFLKNNLRKLMFKLFNLSIYSSKLETHTNTCTRIILSI